MSTPTPYALHGDFAVISLDQPPVNALGWKLRDHLMNSVAVAEQDEAVRLLVLLGAGGAFSVGADVREFGEPPKAPLLPELCNRIEACAKPVLAAIHGVALGGGFELALAAHYRIAVPGARVGLPEVQLGLLPGAGGTQRAPRLAGIAPALDLMLSGRQLPAEDALRLGLIDRIGASGDLLEAALRHARELLAANAPVRRTRDAAAALANLDEQRAALGQARDTVTRKSRGLFSPLKIVEAVGAALDRPFDEGLALERKLFQQCLASPQWQGLIHAFFAEREVAKIPEAKAAKPRPVENVGVIGGGTMGAGTALRPQDVDVVFLFGYGLPRHRGGPLRYADMVGLDQILNDIRRFAGEDPILWRDSPLLVELAASGRTFDSLNAPH